MVQLVKIGIIIEQIWGLEEENKKEESGDNDEGLSSDSRES